MGGQLKTNSGVGGNFCVTHTHKIEQYNGHYNIVIYLLKLRDLRVLLLTLGTHAQRGLQYLL